MVYLQPEASRLNLRKFLMSGKAGFQITDEATNPGGFEPSS